MSGLLDNLTILRYAHIDLGRQGGGTEQYLKQLNNRLLGRSRLTIIQMHLVSSSSAPLDLRVEESGLGRLIWVPIRICRLPRNLGNLHYRLETVFREYGRIQGSHSVLLGSLFRRELLRYFRGMIKHLLAGSMIFSESLGRRLKGWQVDLVSFHWFSYDAIELVDEAKRLRIPIAYVNHFENARLESPRLRRLIELASGVGGVSARNVPRKLIERFVNLSDGVDTDFFSPERVKPVDGGQTPLVLLPARVAEGKGHLDLLHAATTIPSARFAFAGAIDSRVFYTELVSLIEKLGLNHRVTFLGEVESSVLRDWYGASDVVVLPSRSEGLGRVLLEAQAMERPVVAYSCGGMPDAMVAGHTGILVPFGEVLQLGQAINGLLTEPGRCMRMGRSGREFVLERFSLDAMVRRHEQFCLKSISNKADASER